MAANNMYRVGDAVYFEVSASTPYQIRRIEELNKVPSGDVEAKVTCFFRRRDLTNTLLQQAARYYSIDDFDSGEESDSEDGTVKKSPPKVITPTENPDKKLTAIQKHHLRHRELFLSRQVEVLPAKHIRGKCSITLYNNVEPLSNYLNREDAFYYKLIYDPSQKTLQEDRGTLRIGLEYQCPVQPLLQDKNADLRMDQKWEELTWDPSPTAPLTKSDFETFLTLCRSVGTYARAYDPTTLLANKTGCPASLMSAVASANRDMTLQLAHNLLHDANYDLKKAMHLLTPNGCPLMCKDQLDIWSSNELQLFEDAIEKYSKVFHDIRNDFLPWKGHQAIVEMYYFWKTTDRYVKRRRSKLAAQEHKLKQVYIPNYNKPNQSVLFQNAAPNHLVTKKALTGCDCCSVNSSTQWYAWGPTNMLCKLCSTCWNYWKKFGGLKTLDASNKASNLSEREMRAQERLEAAAALANTDSIKPEGNNPPTNQNGTPTLLKPRIVEGPYGGTMPLVFDLAGPAGTVCQMTPSFIRISRLTARDLTNNHRIARKLGIPAWNTSPKATYPTVTDLDSLLVQMKQVAKEAMVESNDKRGLLLAKLKNASKRQSKKIEILACIDKIAKLKGVHFTSAESLEIIKSLKRPVTGDDSSSQGPVAKKQLMDTPTPQ